MTYLSFRICHEFALFSSIKYKITDFFLVFLESGAEVLLVKIPSGHPGDVQHI